MRSEEELAELERLLDRVERRGLSGLAPQEVPQLGRLYRRAAAWLSRSRTRGQTGAALERLNRVVARAYSVVYSAPAGRSVSVRRLILEEFPTAVRRHVRFVWAAIGMFLIGAAIGGVLTAANPRIPDVLLGPGAADEMQRLADRHVGIKNWMPDPERPMASAMIITNNIKVSFLAFSTGLLLGVGTLWVMWYNGLMIGTIAAITADHGVALNFWAFVLPHGVLELPAIFLSGAAGLMLGYSLVNPGPVTRADALRLAGRDAAPLLAGIVVMLLMAGTIEGFFSPVPQIPSPLKIMFAAILFGCMLLFFLTGGRSEAPNP